VAFDFGADAGLNNPVESFVVDLPDLVDTRQAGGKFIDVDQEIPAFSAGTSRSILPSRIIALMLPKNNFTRDLM
jgi:hypothetical protein